MQKRPPKSSKNEMLIFGLCSTSDDWLSNLSDESQPKCKKRPPKSSKNKFSFLDYIQLLMISQAILAISQPKCKKGPLKSSKNEMLIFGLCSTSDDCNKSWGILATKVDQNAKKGPLSHQKIAHFWIMFNFWWLAEQSEWWATKMQKRPP